MSRALVIGSGNEDKCRELAALLKGLDWDVHSLKAYPAIPAPDEDGETFEDNALLKARYYCAQLSEACVADDSGLEVDALDGAPGVYSARYAGEACSYADNNAKLLNALEEKPWHERTARFVCCAAFVTPEGEAHVIRGTVEGHVAVEMYGDKGFGYDPLFVPDGEERTFAEMLPEEKHALSHRGRAFRLLRAYLESRS